MSRSHFVSIRLYLLGVLGCATATDAPISSDTQARGDRFVQAIALSLDHVEHRTAMLEAMRSSQAVDRRIVLGDFFASSAGRGMAAGVERALAIDSASLAATVRDGQIVALFPSERDRRTYTGEDELIVATMRAAGSSHRASIVAFHPSRGRVEVSWRVAADSPILLVTPNGDFVQDLSVRSLRPKPLRVQPGAILDGTGRQLHSVCEPEVLICEDGPAFIWPVGPALAPPPGCEPFSALTSPGASGDADHDGFKDSCENALATAFQPRLVFHPSEQFGLREPKFMAQPYGASLEVAYLLSYYYDGPLYTHVGDSEWIVLMLRPAGTSWGVTYMRTSAHYGSLADASAVSWAYDIDFTLGPAPVVYVANSHHANYRSVSACHTSGVAPPYDDCANLNNGTIQSLGVATNDNVGSSQAPFDLHPTSPGGPDCTLSEYYPVRPGVECYLNAWVVPTSYFALGVVGNFAGWSAQWNNNRSKHYYFHLRDLGFVP